MTAAAKFRKRIKSAPYPPQLERPFSMAKRVISGIGKVPRKGKVRFARAAGIIPYSENRFLLYPASLTPQVRGRLFARRNSRCLKGLEPHLPRSMTEQKLLRTGPTSVRRKNAMSPRVTDELFQCFPTLRSWQPRILTCTKTEKRPGGKSNVHPQVYGANFHGVNGLAVAIPGKASFMFDLAEQVVAEIESCAAP
jgi:hypothetical protein